MIFIASRLDILRFINWYKAYYQAVKGKQHPYLKKEQFERVYSTLESYCNTNSVDIEQLEVMAESFFHRVKQTDHNINHFANDGVLDIRFFDSGLY